MKYFVLLLASLVACKQDVGLGFGSVAFIITCDKCSYSYYIRSIKGGDNTPQNRINWKSPKVKTQRRTIVELQIVNESKGPVYGQILINDVVVASNMQNFNQRGVLVVRGNNYK